MGWGLLAGAPRLNHGWPWQESTAEEAEHAAHIRLCLLLTATGSWAVNFQNNPQSEPSSLLRCSCRDFKAREQHRPPRHVLMPAGQGSKTWVQGVWSPGRVVDALVGQ